MNIVIRPAEVYVVINKTIGESEPGGCVHRIQLERLLHIRDSLLGVSMRAAIVKRTALQIQRVGLLVRRPRGFRHFSFQQRHLEGLDYGAGNLILHLEDIVQLSVVGFRPDVIAVIDSNQLCRDSQRITGLADASFQNVRNAQRLRHVGDRGLLALEVERRGPRRYL